MGVVTGIDTTPGVDTSGILERAVVKGYEGGGRGKTYGELIAEKRAKAEKCLAKARGIIDKGEEKWDVRREKAAAARSADVSSATKSATTKSVDSVKEDVIPAEVLCEPYDPPRASNGACVVDAPMKELAMRELCRRRLLPFVERFRPKYLAGWVHRDICRRIENFVEQVEAGKSPRLLLLCPLGVGRVN